LRTDLGSVWSDPRIQAVLICAENSRHAVLTVAAAGAGKHVLCEKPMATTLAECDEMIAACRGAGVHYMQTFPKRFDPIHQEVRRMVAAGELGRIVRMRIRHGHYFGLGPWATDPAEAWFQQPELSGGGAYLDEGIHAVDLMRWIFGDPVSVVAQMGRSAMDSQVEDHGVAIYGYPGGVTCVHESSWVDLAAESTMEIYGTEAVLVHGFTDCATTRNADDSWAAGPVRVWRRAEPDRGWQPVSLPVTFGRYHHRVAEQFVAALAAGEGMPVTGEDGRAALALILAAYESDRRGTAVRLRPE
jgi:predicted dehydrogenase